MPKFQHHLNLNPLLHTDNYISFVEKEIRGKNFQFSINFFVFNIFWLLQKKMFGLVPLWMLMMSISLQFYYYLLDGRNPLENQLLLTIIIVPHLIVSCFIYKIQKIYNDNLIWKHHDNIEYLLIRLKPYNILGFSIFTALSICIIFSYFVQTVTSEMTEKNKAKAFYQMLDSQTPENQAKIENILKLMEDVKKNNPDKK